MSAFRRSMARACLALTMAAAGLGAFAATASAATTPNTGTWANSPNMQWNCTPSGLLGEQCALQGPADQCTETTPSGSPLGGCAATLDFGSVLLEPGCNGSGSANFVYFPSVGVQAQTTVSISVNAGTASVVGAWNTSSSSGTVSASFTFVCPLPGNSGNGVVNWSGQVNES